MELIYNQSAQLGTGETRVSRQTAVVPISPRALLFCVLSLPPLNNYNSKRNQLSRVQALGAERSEDQLTALRLQALLQLP